VRSLSPVLDDRVPWRATARRSVVGTGLTVDAHLSVQCALEELSGSESTSPTWTPAVRVEAVLPEAFVVGPVLDEYPDRRGPGGDDDPLRAVAETPTGTDPSGTELSGRWSTPDHATT
jgi:hypothetical protein